MAERISVRVPATSANLGCLFDCAALALNLYLNLRVTPRKDHDLSVKYGGLHPERIPLDGTNLVARTITDLLQEWKHPHGFDLEIANEIPVGAGLGSSAAAIVGAIAAAHWLANITLFDEQIVTLASRLDGHPDNVAAAWLGGFTVAVESPERVQAYSCPIPEAIQFVLVVPDYSLPTEKARRVLPAQYSRQDAIHNLQRAVILASQFFSGRPNMRACLFDDRWHQPFRAPLIPGLSEVLDLRMPELYGVCLSGAGPSILAFVRSNPQAVGDAICGILAQHGVRADVHNLAPDNRGAKGWSQLKETG
jgi:homoserine kinase